MYLLDTDILSNLLRPSPSPHLASRVDLTPQPLLATTSVSIAELLFGAYKNRSRTLSLLAKMDELITSDTTVHPFDQAAARIFGELKARLEFDGTPIGDADTQIAAIALARDLTLVTANTRHFARVAGLRVENWLD